MVPITRVLTTALIVGAATAPAEGADQAIKDAYNRLKTLAVSKLGSGAQLENIFHWVEEDPDSQARQSVLQEALEEAFATDPRLAQDRELLEQSMKVYDLLQQIGIYVQGEVLGAQVGKIVAGTAQVSLNIEKVEAGGHISGVEIDNLSADLPGDEDDPGWE